MNGASMNRGRHKHRAQDDSSRFSAAESGRRKQQLPEPIKRHGRARHASAPPPPPPPLPPPPPCDPPKTRWRAIFSAEHGEFYFYNINTGETTWEPPTEARGKRGDSSCIANQKNIAEKRGTVTVRSRSTVILSRGGKIECGGGARSIHPDEASKKTPVPGDRTEETRTGTGPSLQSTRRRAPVPAARSLEGSVTIVAESEGCQRKPAPRNKKRYPGDETTGQTPRRKKGHQSEKYSVSDATSSRRVALSLMQAEDWLANNGEDIPVRQQYRRRGSDLVDCAHEWETRARRASGVSLASRVDQVGAQRVRQDRGMVPHELPGASVRLRGKAAAVWAAMQAQQKEEDEMTGTPEITRLGQSKHRSVDDLFLFQRNVDASRRHKQNQRDTQEESLVTGRPETCSRSALLVERMRRYGNGVDLSTSQRLHENASERRRRQQILQTRVRTAIRRRANPRMSTRSRSLPGRGRRDVSDRLYQHALVLREEAVERERLAQEPPRGVTFRPEIMQRSGVLAQRRRDRWASLGLDVSGKNGGSAVQEMLLAEGTLYSRRRQERRTRQEQLARRSQTPTINRYSRRLLRDAKRMGRSIGTQSDSGNRLRASQAAQAVEEEPPPPQFEALSTSKRMLESRYGRDSIPSMEQRAKERELERLERRAQSAERDKENRIFVARRTVCTSSRSESPEKRHRPEMAVAYGGDGDIYQRTTAYVRRKESRRASEREALLAEELAGCTFAPTLPTRRRGSSRRQSVATDTGSPCSPTSPGTFDAVEHQVANQEDRRVDDSGGSSGGPKRPQGADARHRQPSVVSGGGWLSSPTAEDQKELDAGDGESDSSLGSPGDDCSSGGSARRWAGSGRESSGLRSRTSQGEGNDHSILRDDDDASAESGNVFRPVGGNGGGRTATVKTSLPKGWTAFTSPEGWEYFFHNETGVVQWKRPTR